MEIVGAVLVVGAGIGGSQAALDLADSGYKVYLIESSTSIGGVMAQLDKTFPTNDCAICIVSPKLVEAGRHPNIDIKINTEIERVSGKAGNFSVDLVEHTLYIDPEICTGCGVCGEECPVEAIDMFNEGLSKQAATSVKYPQAVPLVFAIDRNECIGCGICRGVCKAKAIDYNLNDKKSQIKVGATIIAIGFDEFEPEILNHYGYGKYKNVVTSIQFERILSASGPYSGHVLRPSDGNIPQKIAFLHCVGSRDPHFGKEYCSSVCCMYTAKEAVIAKEHTEGLEATIFSMDIRAYGKDFDKYINRAQNEYGVCYIRSRVSSICEDKTTKDLKIVYEAENGDIIEEKFDMVVLGVGLNPPKQAKKIAEKFGIELNDYGFLDTRSLSPVETLKRGIYVCGACSSPKDIPETVIEASAAASKVNTILSDARNTLVTKKEYPPEINVIGEPPRIGVFICHCGINIGGYIDVPEVVDYAEGLPDVVYAERNLYTCSADTQTHIKEQIQEQNLNRVIVASCTPRTHEPLFQETIREIGLNKYLFQMTNIRDQCSWVHMREPKRATEKAKDLVRMAVAKARLNSPLSTVPLDITHSALVIGGGISGMTAALNFAEEGYETFIIERQKSLGGFAPKIYETLEKDNIQKFLRQLIEKVSINDNIQVFLNSKIESIDGYIGNFETIILKGSDSEKVELKHGVTIVATGAKEYKPKEYLYGEADDVITQQELEEKLFTSDYLNDKKSVTMIQCVGSRNDENPYCSRMCCSEAIKNATNIKEKYPQIEITILYRDIRSYGFKEIYYRKAREMGILFVRFENDKPPIVNKTEEGIEVIVDNPKLGELKLTPDLVVLSTGIVAPSEENERLAKMLKVPLNEDKFFLEAHVKLRPVDFATDGIFLCGTARGPATISESISQANSAVSRATTILSKEKMLIGGVVSNIDKDLCTGCKICVRICPFNAIVKDEEGYAYVQEALCKGCGVCGASCPEKAIKVKHFTNEQILSEIYALGGKEVT
ncbi:MAG: 4Fe-4S dicluster domain-containing protein [Candidatus Lokiarchaeota archaeon]|nr:4Fe-4S dicluster domain-containing protein [Candidatus Lokiarchaeota archaeon]MBD3337922.1 4Fe-4S dicluster domain-containing protein [Candidatus Lokiarchaeota archaeon]